MKNFYILLIMSTVFSFQSFSQEILMETGVAFTSFDFKNSQGEELDNLQPTTNSFISLGYRQNVLKEVLHIVGGFNFNKYGAVGSDDSINLFYEWETSYLGIYLGLDVKVFSTEKVSFYLRGTTSSEFLLQGTQTLNNQVFDLKGVEEFDSNTFFFRGGAIIEYTVSDNLSIFTQYKYGQSTENGNTQKLKYKSSEIGLGLVVKLNQKNSNETKGQEPTNKNN